jgi:hypothetical protein
MARSREATIAAFSLGGLLGEEAAAILCQQPSLEAVEECWRRRCASKETMRK